VILREGDKVLPGFVLGFGVRLRASRGDFGFRHDEFRLGYGLLGRAVSGV